MSKFIRNYGKYIVILFLFIVVGNVLLYLTYKNVKREMIEGLNARQLIHAKQAARGIETFFGDNINILQNYSKNEHIVAIDESGKRLMREFLSSQAGGVSIISREDSQGRILYAEPYDRKVIGQPVTKMEVFLKAKRTRQTTVSDVFTNRRGFQSIIVHAPIFRRGSFDGTLAMLFSFDFIAKRYIDDIRIGKDGYAWMISRDGTELSCPVPGHVGNSVFDNCREFPDILAMAQRMIRGEQGVTTYLFDRIRGGAVSKTTKHAVFMPIRLGDNFWSIVVATPEDEVLSIISEFRDRLLLIAIFFVIGIGFFLYMLIKMRIVIKEVEKRRKTEEALKESEERYRTLVKNTSEAIYVAQDGMLKFINRAGVEIAGYSEQEIISKPFIEFIHPDDRAMVGERYLKRLKGEGYESRYAFRFIAKNGVIKWLELGAALIDFEGRPATLNVVTDITDRKRAEEVLKDSEDRYRNIIENMLDVYYRSDREGKLIMISPSGVDLLGYNSGDDYIGKIVADTFYFDPKERDRMLSILKEKGSVKDFEVTLKHKDGTPISVSTSSGYYYNEKGEILGVEGLFRDMTERKQAEEALKKSEEQLIDAYRLAHIGIWHWIADTDTVTWTEELYRITGLDPTSPAPTYSEHPNIYAPESWDRLKVAAERTLETGAPYQLELELIRPDGATRWVNAFGGATYDNHGRVTGVHGTLQDITERKQAEEERKVLHERLNRAEKMEALGLLAGGVAHDLNNVLGVVVGYAELVLMKADESSMIRPQLVNIMNGGLKAAAIVDDLLTLARRGVSDRNVLNLNKIIADCQKSPEFTNLSFHNPSVKIKTDIDPDLLNISGSSVHLGKSLYNLISNASEAMPKGGIVTVKTINQYLDKPIRGYDNIQEGDYVVLSVSDTGEGISADNLKRIFEPFYTKKVMGRSGTGLGLAVVWGTVKDHHGYINVESEEGKGSTFTLYFPVTREAITADAVAIDISEYMGKGESILVVDDVKEQRDLAAGMLRTLNYNVASVSSGEEAIVYVKEHNVDLVVLDMIMDPGMDGLDTYKQVLGIHPKQKAIIVSGFSESDRVRAARDLGAGAYVRKPYIKEKLGLAVKKELADM